MQDDLGIGAHCAYSNWISYDIVQLGSVILVQPGNVKVGRFPFVSGNNQYCRGLVLRNSDDLYAVCHTTSRQDLRAHALQASQKMNTEPRSLQGIIISYEGDSTPREVCGSLGIQVVGSFYAPFITHNSDVRMPYARDILVVPSLGEVTVYSLRKERIFFNT